MQRMTNIYNEPSAKVRNRLASTLCLLMVSTSCTQNNPCMGVKNEPKETRGDITHYQVSSAGVSLIKSFEGLRKTPYICPGGALTVGYGQVIASQAAFDKQYPKGFSEKNAEDLLRNSLAATYAQDIKHLVHVPLSQREFDMLVSLNFNIGAKALHHPNSKPQNDWIQIDMLTPLNRREYGEASLAFPKFTKGGPDKMYYRGLLKRRMAEMFIFRNSTNIPQALRAPIENNNFREYTRCDSIARYWEDSNQRGLRDEALSLYRVYNDQLNASETTR